MSSSWSQDANCTSGLGMYCVELARGNFQPCVYEPHRKLHELNPCDHLCRFYCLCITHFKRNVLALRSQVSNNVYNAMLSLVSAEGHPDIAKTLDVIRRGNRKAKGNSSFILKHSALIINYSMVERQRDGEVCLACHISTNESDTSLHMEGFTIHHKQKLTSSL